MMNASSSSNSVNENNHKMLHAAVNNRNIEEITTLLLHGTDVNAQDEYGKAPIIYAIENNDPLITRLLVINGAEIKNLLITAVDFGLQEESIEIVEILLEHGADVNVSDEYGRTTLHLIVENSLSYDPADNYFQLDLFRAKFTKLLLSRGVNVNAQTHDGLTPLQAATQNECPDVLELLLEHNADVNVRTKSNIIPLHEAVHNHYYYDRMVPMLLKFGAEVDSTGEDRRTALHIACQNGDIRNVEALLEYGADINVTDKNDNTPLEVFLNKFHELLNKSEYFDGNRAVCSEEDVPVIFKRHMMKIKAANLFLNEKNSLWLSANCDKSLEEYENELEMLRSEKVNGSNVYFFNVLTNSTSRLAVYAKNENIVRYMKLFELKTRFPLYGDMMKINFRRGVARKEMLERIGHIFHYLFNDVPELPYICIDKILSYLSDRDLRTIIDG